jgi:hypothetical protein
MRSLEHTKKMAASAALTLVMLSATHSVPAQADENSPACMVGKKYMELVQKADFAAVADLFASNAEFHAPTGVVFKGAAEIRKFYLNDAAALTKLVVRPQDFVGDERDCYFEIWTRSSPNERGIYVLDPNGEFVRGAIDHFTIDDQGRVVRFVAHSSPTANMFE